MAEYKFRFFNRNWRTEAQFALHFPSDFEAIQVAQELKGHSGFARLEVKKGHMLVFRMDPAE